MATESAFYRQRYTIDKVCTVSGLNAGQAYRRVWTTPPLPGVIAGTDAGNNLNVAYARRDQFGLPTIDTDAAPNIAVYGANINTGNIANTAIYMCDGWVVAPIGVTSLRLGSRTLGTCSIGLYAGKSFRYATRIAWNVGGFQSGAIDLTKFTQLCGRCVVAVRLYCCNGYFNGGYQLQWSLDGVTFVDVPVANIFGQQPFQSQYP
jgi:hypothetical protein